MQLTTVSPSLQFSQKHQGNVSNPQHSPSQSTLQAEAPILFGEMSKPKKWTLAAIVLSGVLYAGDALFSPTSTIAEPPQKIETGLESFEEIEMEGLNSEDKKISTLHLLFLLFFSFIGAGLINKELSKRGEISRNNEAIFKSLENNPELMAKFKEVLMNLPLSALENPAPTLDPAKSSATERLIFKNMLKTASAIGTLLTQKQYMALIKQTPGIIVNKKSPAEAMALYKQALGPKFNWKPLEELITAFMKNPTGEEKPKK